MDKKIKQLSDVEAELIERLNERFSISHSPPKLNRTSTANSRLIQSLPLDRKFSRWSEYLKKPINKLKVLGTRTRPKGVLSGHIIVSDPQPLVVPVSSEEKVTKPQDSSRFNLSKRIMALITNNTVHSLKKLRHKRDEKLFNKNVALNETFLYDDGDMMPLNLRTNKSSYVNFQTNGTLYGQSNQHIKCLKH